MTSDPTAVPLERAIAGTTLRRELRDRRRRPRSAGERSSPVAIAVLTIAAILILGPFVITIITTFRSNAEYTTSTSIWPEVWTLDNYVDVFTRIPMARMIFNGLFIAILATAGNLLASL